VAGRHVRRRRGARWLPLAGTVVAVTLIFLVVQARPYLERRNLLPGADGCDRTVTVNLVTGPELAGLLSQLAGDYTNGRHRVDGRCVQPTVTADEPGAVVHYLARDWEAVRRHTAGCLAASLVHLGGPAAGAPRRPGRCRAAKGRHLSPGDRHATPHGRTLGRPAAGRDGGGESNALPARMPAPPPRC
jgi:hypothetical protein